MKTLQVNLAAAIVMIAAALLITGCADERTPDKRRVTVSTLVAEEAVVPDGSLTVGWRFELADGWHLYTNGRSDSGLPPEVNLDLPDGWSAGPLRWPVGERHVMPGGLLDHIYEHEVVLLQTLQVPEDLPPHGEISFTARLRWLACKDACVPGDSTLTVVVPIGTETGETTDATVLEAVERNLPRPTGENKVAASWAGSVLGIAVEDAERLEFHPAANCGDLVDALTDGAVAAESMTLRFEPKDGRVGPARGVLVARSGGVTRRLILDIPATELEGDRE